MEVPREMSSGVIGIVSPCVVAGKRADGLSFVEPVSGFEPLTVRLQEACPGAFRPLPARMPHESAIAAPKTREFPGDPFHASFHAPGIWPARDGEVAGLFFCITVGSVADSAGLKSTHSQR